MKQTTIIISTIGFILITLNSCNNNSGYKYFEGTFPENPVNLKQINSEFDDYNSTIPYLGETFPLCFSSNRNSNGDDYDIIYKFMFIMFSKTDGSLDIIEQTSSDVYEQHLTLNNALNKINTSSDEFGPNIIYHGLNVSETTYTGNYKTFVFLYSNNSNGNQNIMFTHNYANENFEIPIEVEFLNSDYNDAYPTFNKDNSEIYFTSDRNGIYNIHKTEVNNTNGIIAILTDKSIDTIKTDTILSSINNDKCPYILNNFIVFASDRDGGFGGYDLYYSFKKDGEWIEPINFGNKINTEFDEYRPIVRSLWDFSNDFMLFSSNRPGGKGGFDLYYVGIDKINNGN